MCGQLERGAPGHSCAPWNKASEWLELGELGTQLHKELGIYLKGSDEASEGFSSLEITWRASLRLDKPSIINTLTAL